MKCKTCISLFLSIIFTLSHIQVQGAITIATSDGNWNNGGTWSNGVPACGDTVIIDTGSTVTVTSHVNLDETSGCSTAIHIEIYGVLKFNTGRKMYLPCNSFVSISGIGSLDKGNGGGNSNVIDICESTVWNAASGSQGGPISFGTGTPLPITLLEFKVILVGNNVMAEWITVAEINNDYFTLEKSINGIDFEVAGLLDGAGNSSSQLNYQIIDDNPYEGTSYYRLKQTDFNGEYSYSNLRAVKIGTATKPELLIYPNPSNGVHNISVSGADFNSNSITILDLTGRVVYNGPVNLTINLMSKPGIYSVNLYNSSGQLLAQQKLILTQ